MRWRGRHRARWQVHILLMDRGKRRPGGGGDGAATYVVMSATGSLSSERVLTAGTGINVADGGAGSTVTLSVRDSVVATISGSTFTGVSKFNSGLSGSLTRLVNGTSYLAAGNNITITSASNGQITISSTATGGDSGPTFFSSTTAGSIFTTPSLAPSLAPSSILEMIC